ncbi:hypothetical protein [Solibacillus sp. FSL K6-1523]|uniref:hypothetical protein n=1 Tax=Solibacillus sp. FSL K6-1523 TaxID=2921471 RepID=UPI0030F64A24
MIKKKRIIIIIVIIAIGLFIYIINGNRGKMVIYEGFLNLSEIEYLEVVGIDNKLPTKITDTDDIQRIILLLQQLNGPIEFEHIPSDEALFGLSIVLKEHYPSSEIIIYQDKVFHGQGRNVSEELVNELVVTIESSF